MKTWETFLRIESRPAGDEPPALDDAWMLQRGIDPISPAVLRHIRDDVAPLVRLLGGDKLDWYCFLVHGASSGVPTTPDDKDAYIHLRLGFEDDGDDNHFEDYMRANLPRWTMTRRWEMSKEMAGVDEGVLPIEQAWLQLYYQSEWFVSFVEANRGRDLAALVKHVRQFLHFFANMAQMKVA